MKDKTQKGCFAKYGYKPPEQGVSRINRPEYQYIIDWIEPESRVLDICCGDGSLGELLIKEKKCDVYGIEIDSNGVEQCMAKGVKAKVGDVDIGLEYQDKFFDYSVINVTLQMVYRPDLVLEEALRVAKRVIVSFPNFAFWKSRLELFFKGIFPTKPLYGYSWYNTRHIHLFSYKDFTRYLNKINVMIKGKHFLGESSRQKELVATCFPNMFSMVCILLIEPEGEK